MAGLENDTVGGNFEGFAVDLGERSNDGGDQIRAAAHGFGEDDFGQFSGAEVFDGGSERVEVAAEAGSGYFSDVEPLGPQILGIDEVSRLVVGDDPDFFAECHVVPGQSCDGCRLAGSEKAADHDVYGSHCDLVNCWIWG